MVADPTGSSALLKMKKSPAEDKTFSIPISVTDNQGLGVTQKFEGEWFGEKSPERFILSQQLHNLCVCHHVPICVCECVIHYVPIYMCVCVCVCVSLCAYMCVGVFVDGVTVCECSSVLSPNSAGV